MKFENFKLKSHFLLVLWLTLKIISEFPKTFILKNGFLDLRQTASLITVLKMTNK